MEETTPAKPKWLRRLERESWQAELIISGAAIFGTLQLPNLLEQFQHYLLLNYSRSSLSLWFFATSYWALFVYCLIFVFILHFVIRALWIGLIGLNSVYPDGIVANHLTSEDYQEKAQKEYGDIDGYIRTLDDKASTIFGVGFTFAGLFFNLGLVVSLSIVIVTWLQGLGVKQFWSWVIGLLPFSLIMFMSVANSIFNLRSLREKEWVKRYHFPTVKLLSKLTYPINTRFTVTGLSLLSSQSLKNKPSLSSYIKSFAISMLGFFALGITLALSEAIKPQFMDKVYHRMGNDPTGIDVTNYQDAKCDCFLFEPQLSSQYLTEGAPLSLWVPLPERELRPMLDNCSEPAVSEDLEREPERLAKRQRLVNCAKEYVEIYLDNLPLPALVPYREYRSAKSFDHLGVRFELTSQQPSPGSHVLKVITHYPLEEGEEENYRTTYIPFEVLGR